MGVFGGSGSYWLEHKQNSYLFIDGGYLRERCKQVESVLGATGELDYSKITGELSCGKAFYYDCLDEPKTSEPQVDFEARRRMQEESFNKIREVPGFHVRTGTLSGRRQKEVDVALAVDMLTHAFYKNMSRAVLVAGDLDFRPVVESLIRLGTYVEVVSAKSNTAKLLEWAADQHRVLDFNSLYSWCTDEFKQRNPIPRIAPSEAWMPKEWQFKRNGSFRGEEAVLLQRGGDWMIQCYLSPGGPIQNITSPDRDVLERYFDAVYGIGGDKLVCALAPWADTNS